MPVAIAAGALIRSSCGKSSWASWAPVTRRRASSMSISPSSTIATAARNAACGVRLATLVCRTHSRPSSIVNSMSHTSR